MSGWRLALVLAAVAGSAAAAETAGPVTIESVSAGFAGRYKVGLWAPLCVTVDNGGAPLAEPVRLSVVVADGDGAPSRIWHELPGGLASERQAVKTWFRPGRLETPLEIAVEAAGRTLAKRVFEPSSRADAVVRPALHSGQSLVLVFGGPTQAWADALREPGQTAENRPEVVEVGGDDLPAPWFGYEGVSLVVLNVSTPEQIGRLALSSAQWRALREWCERGGRIVLLLGPDASEALAAHTPLAELLPGKPQGRLRMPSTSLLESFAETNQPIESESLYQLRLAAPRGAVAAGEIESPLVVRSALGLGQVVAVTVDVQCPALSRWAGHVAFLRHILARPARGSDESSEATGPLMHYGVVDLASQLRRAINQFSGLEVVPFWLVAVLIVVYLLLIGPGDYWFVGKLLRRTGLTWVTLGLVIAVFCGGGWFVARQTQGTQPKVNQVDLVEFDTASGEVFGTTWLDYYAPRFVEMDVTAEPLLAGLEGSRQVQLSWLGMPGRVLGGMAPQSFAASLWDEPYDYGPSFDKLSGVRLAAGSSKSLTCRWAGKHTVDFGKLREESQALAGALVNPTAWPLDRCILVYGRWAYDLGKLEPGEAATVGPSMPRSDLQTYLTGRKIIFGAKGNDSYRQEAVPYDPTSNDVAYLLRTMLFFEAAGGRSYTRLDNGYQGFVDRTPLLAADRAVLLAWAGSGKQTPGTRFGFSSQSPEIERKTAIVAVLPVERGRP